MRKMAPGAAGFYVLLAVIFLIAIGVGYCIGRFG